VFDCRLHLRVPAAPGDTLINNVGDVALVPDTVEFDTFCPVGQWMATIGGVVNGNSVGAIGRVSCSNSTRFPRYGNSEGTAWEFFNAQGFNKIVIAYSTDSGISSIAINPLAAGTPTAQTYGTAKSGDQSTELVCPANTRVASLFGQVKSGALSSLINVGIVCRPVGEQ